MTTTIETQAPSTSLSVRIKFSGDQPETLGIGNDSGVAKVQQLRVTWYWDGDRWAYSSVSETSLNVLKSGKLGTQTRLHTYWRGTFPEWMRSAVELSRPPFDIEQVHRAQN